LYFACLMEVTNDHAIFPGIAAVPEQEGIFDVRSDGRGLRRLGPASRDPNYVIVPEPRSSSGGLTAKWGRSWGR